MSHFRSNAAGRVRARQNQDPGEAVATLKRVGGVLALASLVCGVGGAPAAAQPAPMAGRPSSPAAAAAAAPAPLDAATRGEVVEALARALADGYASAERGQQMAQLLRSKLTKGDYDAFTSGVAFADALKTDLRSVVSDGHLNVLFNPQPPRMSPGGPGGGMRAMNGAIRQVKILGGNVGYMEVNGHPPVAAARDAIAAAFAFLHNTDALIIDSRGNGGGDPETVALYMSYLSEGAPYAVNRVHWRQGDRVEDIKTTDLGALSYGANKPVFYLTSQRTRSAGEEFAYDVQSFKRGVIVGGTTAGAANPGGFKPLGHGFSAFVPNGYVVHPVTGGNWEGVGVKPDVPVRAEQALVEAHRLAVERLQAAAADPRSRAALGALALTLKAEASDDPGPTTRLSGAPSRTTAKAGGLYHLNAGPARLPPARIAGRYSSGMGPEPEFTVAAKADGLYLTTPRNPEARLIWLGADRYRLEGCPDDFTAVFSLTGDGKVQLMLDLGQPVPSIAFRQ